MKKFSKYIVIVVLCLIAGFFFMINTKSEKKSYATDSADILSIDVNDRINKVNVILSDDEEIHVTYYDKKNNIYEISTTNQILYISNASSSRSEHVNAGINFKNTPLTIAVPASFTGTLKADTFNDCNVDTGINFSDVDVISLSELLE